MNVILDLDETLINAHRMSKFTEKHYRRARLFEYKNMENKYIVVARPGLDSFLDWLFSKYTVTVWTAASRPYALFIVKNFIMTKPGRTPLYIFSSKHCDVSQKHGKSHKDLDMLFKLYPEQYTRKNTIIIDDHEDVCASQKSNSYHIQPFLFLESESYIDKQLLHLKQFLETHTVNRCN